MPLQTIPFRSSPFPINQTERNKKKTALTNTVFFELIKPIKIILK